MRIVLNRRARLGIKVNLQARDDRLASAPTWTRSPPAVPRPQAGLRSGDVITKLDGKSVLRGGAAEARDARQSLPGLRLIELAARLEPNDTVPVEFRRGKDRRTVSVVTEDEPDMVVRARAAGGRSACASAATSRSGDGHRMPAGDFMERFEPPGAPVEFFGRLPAGPPRAGAPQPRSGPVLRHRPRGCW